MDLKSTIKKLFKKVGVDVRLVCNIEAHQKMTWEEKWGCEWKPFLLNHDIRTIIDIGANTGQFATMIHKICPSAKIYSFEPLNDCFQRLKKTIETIPGAEALNLALGNTNGTGIINRSEFTPCSSMLQPAELLKRDWPDSAKITKEKIKIARLDDIFSNMDLKPELFIKIDVQGFENKVIQGGSSIIANTSLVVIETCFYEHYLGQPLFDEIYQMMLNFGFAYRGNAGQSEGISKVDGRLLYADAVFENERLAV